MAVSLNTSSVLRNNKLILGLIALLIMGAFFGALRFLENIYQTETYYVLVEPIPTRTQVTPEMLTPVVTSKGTKPDSLTLADVQTGGVYTRIPLNQGDVLTMSNTGGFDDISVGIPDSWVVTNFAVGADDAVGGRVRRGVYFDMMAVTREGTFYPFVNVLALDTSVSLSSASSNEAAETGEAKSGQTEQYYVGFAPEEAARFHDMLEQHGENIKLVLSPRQNEYNEPDLEAYVGPNNGMFRYSVGDEITNSGELTDNTFSRVDRDEFGRPVDYRPDGTRYDGTEEPVGNSGQVSFEDWTKWIDTARSSR